MLLFRVRNEHYAMLDRVEGGEIGLTIHFYGHTIDHTECGSPCIILRVRALNQLGSHTCTARSINNAPRLRIYKQTSAYNNSEVIFSTSTPLYKHKKKYIQVLFRREDKSVTEKYIVNMTYYVM